MTTFLDLKFVIMYMLSLTCPNGYVEVERRSSYVVGKLNCLRTIRRLSLMYVDNYRETAWDMFQHTG